MLPISIPVSDNTPANYDTRLHPPLVVGLTSTVVVLGGYFATELLVSHIIQYVSIFAIEYAYQCLFSCINYVHFWLLRRLKLH